MRIAAAIFALCSLAACAGEAPAPAGDDARAAGASAGAAPVEKQPAADIQAAVAQIQPAGPEDLPPRPDAASEDRADTAAATEAGADTAEAGAEPTAVGADTAEAPAEPTDPLAPILPEVAEPGSAEADAELLALLDESTLTQEEFEQGFGPGGPKLDGDQFEFGPNSRTRGTPVVRVGAIEGPGAKQLATQLEAERRKLEGCLAMGLSKDEGVTGSLRLRLRFDAKGAVQAVDAEALALGGASEIRESLTTCLRSVPAKWELAEAAGASVSVPLTLTIDEA